MNSKLASNSATVGLVVRPGTERVLDVARSVLAWSAERGCRAVVEKGSALSSFPSVEAVEVGDMVDHSHFIVTLGGDGTLIGIARHIKSYSPSLVGVNFGNLGFLTEFSPGEVFSALEEVLRGDAQVGERKMLRATVLRGEQIVFSSNALNDAVILKEPESRLLELDLAVNGEDLMRLRSDGLIVATPTGSTAYSLAAGGSIALPTLNLFLVTPICAHSLTIRPLILGFDDVISVAVPPYEGRVVLSVDGQVSVPLLSGDLVRIDKSPAIARVVHSKTKSYFGILRTKLNWGIANKAE